MKDRIYGFDIVDTFNELNEETRGPYCFYRIQQDADIYTHGKSVKLHNFIYNINKETEQIFIIAYKNVV